MFMYKLYNLLQILINVYKAYKEVNVYIRTYIYLEISIKSSYGMFIMNDITSYPQ